MTTRRNELPNGLNVQSGQQVFDVQSSSASFSSHTHGPLNGIRILIVIAAYDFSQLPHLEEILDTYQDLCVSGPTKVDVIIHTTVPYPVTLIDLWNTRLLDVCREVFTVTIVLKPPSLRLHLVDCHRTLFYDKIQDYDLFVYTEDDIRVSPRTIASYLAETQIIRNIMGENDFSNFNVGIVRYEYNYPSNVIIDDRTRHATQNVTRVYWEHGQYPIIPTAVDFVPQQQLVGYVHMRNHHQGMYLATRELLLAWRERKGCHFDQIRDRPSMAHRPSQPSEGTQRVWMSSQMLYGSRHCNVQQVIPIARFGTLTVWHLPNKNYRRVGHFRNRTFADGSERFDISTSLLTALRLHLELIKASKLRQQQPIQQRPRKYWGVMMVDEVGNNRNNRSPLLERRLNEFQAYVDRGGILSESDMAKVDLVEAQ